MTQRTTATDADLDWLLDGLVDQVAGARHAIVLSDDGLVISRSKTIDRSDAERLAAIATGQQSLARGAGQLFKGGPVHQIIVEMAGLWLFVISAGRGTHLAVIASQQVGQKLGTDTRTPPSDDAGRAG